MLPRHARCVLSRLRCNGHSLLLGSYLSRIGRIFFLFFLFLFAIFILHSRESELYRYTLDGKSALAWQLPFPRFMGHLSST